MYRNICSKPYVRLYSGGISMNTTYSTYFQTARAVAAYQERSYRNHLRRTRQLTKRIFSALQRPYRGLYRYFDNRFLSRAQASSEPVHYKYFSSIMVYSGEIRFPLFPAAIWIIIIHLSGLYRRGLRNESLQDADDIHAGDYLIIPYYSTDFH